LICSNYLGRLKRGVLIILLAAAASSDDVKLFKK
jgi:hypothetical protein